MARLIIGIIMKIIGYAVFFSALGGAAEGDFITFILLFGLADIFLIGGEVVGGGGRFTKPTFTTPAGAFFGWIFYILFVPFLHFFVDAFLILKGLITLPFSLLKGNRRKSSGGRSSGGGYSSSVSASRPSTSSYSDNRKSGGDGPFDRAVGTICYRHEGYANVGNATSVKYSFSHSIISHSITITAHIKFSVKTANITSEYQVNQEKAAMERYAQNFDFTSIQNAIDSKLDEMIQIYRDLEGEWGFRFRVQTEVETV